ncbi:kelch-like protein 4 isoform X1 [Hippoglossus hippoglossus]|uniref:kelch-like protein 4 isoform X1 n=2 Tax=Hippoglossus hippoglossus TaxID=8267 RepID=UPI00148E7366|nr:kelch-like protein 4 isoform X1 [Hippoglossus hippoglossus]XP_034454018.1 kelch-like protein 4 isoform X1 [Hippoglossus hippoglossus]XP_034454019.1 kelch-like protein 4 isoform X1 [Hippoglossus hippoglossus]XP_035016445.1 kelch-like protein 4 isoform X1 [Hippoglossus stenolepis]
MSVSGKKEFDVKQILRLRWRWFSHSSQGSAGSGGGGVGGVGGYIQQDGLDHRGTPTQGRLKSHSRERGVGGLRKTSSPAHSILAPTPGPTPVYVRAGQQAWHQQNTIQGLQVNEETSKSSSSPNATRKEDPKTGQENVKSSTEEPAEVEARERLVLSTFSRMNTNSSDEFFQATNHAEQTFRKMETYLQHKQLCDVLLIAGDHKIPAHRLVLSAVSDYFAAMFTSDVREAKQEEIKMEGVDPEALRSLVHFAYTGVLELKEETIESLLAAACLLQLPQVIQVCCNFLMKQLHPSNCLGIRSFADAQGCVDLLNVAHHYTMEHFLEVIQNQEFLLLPTAEIVKLLSSDDINVPDEETIFQALMMWVRYDVQHRQKDLGVLLAYIRLPLLPPQLLADLENNKMFSDDLECQKLLMEAMKYHLLPERRPMFQSPRTKPRKSTVGALYAVGGMDATKGSTTIEKYDLRTNTWVQVGVMNGRRLQFGVAVIDNKLYVVGGRDGLKTSNMVECYNPINKVWSTMPPMSTHRHGLGIAVLEGPMYAVGGHDGWSYLNTVERWDPQARQWNYVASMSTPRSTMGVTALNGKLFAVGGRDGSSCLRSMECFDPHTNKWSMCAPMAKRRGGVGVATYNNFLYAVGGHDAPASNHCSRLSDCVERYDPKTDMWTTVSSLSIPRDAVGVCLLGDRLYAVGGYDGQSYLTTVESYDAQNNEWTEEVPLNVGRAGTCVVVVKLP